MLIQKGKLLYVLTFKALIAAIICDVSHLNHRYSNGGQPFQESLTQDSEHDATEWDIRLSVPGEPIKDYPTLSEIPQTAFNCVNKKSGYYADTQTRCQVFRVCAVTAQNGFYSFLCPNGTLFNQEVLVCDWWMNVKCQDSERYMKTDEQTLKSGVNMVSEIHKMIVYPMINPFNEQIKNVKMIEQVYNPPPNLNAFMHNLNSIQRDMSHLGSFKLPGPNAELYQNNFNMNSFSNGYPFLGQNPARLEAPTIPPVGGINFPRPFATANFNGLTLTNQSSSNTQSVKITKQQFTYPSQYDREYTLTLPKVDETPQYYVRLPINLSSVNDNYQVTKTNSDYLSNNVQIPALTNIPKALPLIVLFLQPPLETVKNAINPFNKIEHESFKQHSNHSAHLENVNDASTLIQTKKSLTNVGNHFTSNTASQTNFYITNNFSTPRPTTEPSNPDVETFETVINRPSRLMVNSESTSNKSSNRDLLSIKLTSKDANLVEKKDDRDLVTLFSAHIHSSGSPEHKKVFKICMPKDVLNYLVDLHNSTKQSIYKTYQNEINALKQFKNNTSIYIDGQPFLKKIMDSLVTKNHSNDRQVSIKGEENFYSQQLNPDGYFKTGHKNYVSNDQNQSRYISFSDEFVKNTTQEQKTVFQSNRTDYSHVANYNQFNESLRTTEHTKFDNHGRLEEFGKVFQNYSDFIRGGNESNSHNDNVITKQFSQVTTYPNGENQLFYVNQQTTKFVPVLNTQNDQGTFNQIHQNHKYENVSQFSQGNLTLSGHRAAYDSQHLQSKLQNNFQDDKKSNYAGGIVYAQNQAKQNDQKFYTFSAHIDPSEKSSKEISQYIYTTYQKDLPVNEAQKVKSANEDVRVFNYRIRGSENDVKTKQSEQYQYQQIQDKVSFNERQETKSQINSEHAQYQNPRQYHYIVKEQQKPKISRTNIPSHLLINFDDNQKTSSDYVTQNRNNANNDHVRYVMKSDYQMSHYANQMANQEADNRNYYMVKGQTENVRPEPETLYTTVEVVPALGFSLNTEQERQRYYAAISGGLKNHKEERPDYPERQVVMYPQAPTRPPVTLYATQKTEYTNQNDYSQSRNVHGRIITHVMDRGGQKQAIEDFGYPRERPTVSFTY